MTKLLASMKALIIGTFTTVNSPVVSFTTDSQRTLFRLCMMLLMLAMCVLPIKSFLSRGDTSRLLRRMERFLIALWLCLIITLGVRVFELR